ncbi:MAG: hypothetical protein JNM52_00855 [Betaproteobacteria bacterium]|nr:hypothetical protein [Betaproteobacteria bacterium]
MQELNMQMVENVSGAGLDGYTGAGLILAVVAIAATPITLGVGLGAAAGLVIAQALA